MLETHRNHQEKDVSLPSFDEQAVEGSHKQRGEDGCDGEGQLEGSHGFTCFETKGRQWREREVRKGKERKRKNSLA